MENISLFNEIMLRSESLLIIVYIIFSYYTFRVFSTTIGDDIIKRKLLQMITLTFLLIAILLLGRVILSMPGRSIYEIDGKCLLLGMMLQIAAPLLLYAPVKMARMSENSDKAFTSWVFVPVVAFVANILISVIPAKYYSGAIAYGFMSTIALLLIFAIVYAFLKRVSRFNRLYSTEEHLLFKYGGEISLFWIVLIVTLAIVIIQIFVYIKSEYMVALIQIFNMLNVCVAMDILVSYQKIKNDKFENGFILSEPVFDEKDKNGELRARLLKYFASEKPYLKPNLTVNEVALYLYSNKTYISRVINDSFNLNFNQFVNKFRIEEAKRLYKENTSLSINKLCVSSGFGSIATFTISFRLFAGLSPAEWCKEFKKSMGYVKKG